VGEMGDKTQLLAMAMAGKFKARDVMSGVLLATVLNHALAVLVGSYLGSFLPMNIISVAAGISFIIFGLWTIRGDVEDGKNKKSGKFGPILTVAIAFFIAEMGDKTQLMTLALAAEYRQPLWVLAGTTTGMLIADGIGVLFGAWICSHISESAIKWSAGLIFIFFGSLNLYENAPAGLLAPLYLALYGIIIAGLVYLIGVVLARPSEPLCEKIPRDAE
jgi:Ca2+/H+ antiporter, TMEM165/GDT1 family